jgi:acyl-CoA synthetase (NDP forming)
LGFFSQVGGSTTIAPRLRVELRAVMQRHPDRLHVLSVIAPPEKLREYEADGFLVFEDPSRAVVAIDAMGRFGQAFDRPVGLPPPSIGPVVLPSQPIHEAAAKTLLVKAGISAVPERVCASAAEAIAAAEAFGYPVVLKILSPDIVHKSEIGGVLLGLHDADAVAAGFAELLARARHAAPDARIEGALVARQMQGGVECILGIHRDPVFGPVAMFGLGGIFVEIMRDVVFRRCPFGVDVAERMIRQVRGAPLLLGARGRPPADVPALANMLARLSVFAVQAGPRLRSIDLNPVFAMPAGQGAFAADAVIDLS